MSPSSVSSVSFFCLVVLLLNSQHSASSYASYKQGSTQVFIKTPGKSSGNSQQASTCSSMATGLGVNKLPVVHRQSPCSPLSQTTADVLRRDVSLIRRPFSSHSSTAGTIIPINGSSDQTMTTSIRLDYSVVVSYGTPAQQFPMFLDNSFGATMLRCKPCASGSDDCDPVFDTSRSSTFRHVYCGSADCPTNCPDGSICPFNHRDTIKGTFAEDVLTLAPSVAIHNFRFACVDEPSGDEWRRLDLSRDSNSLPSQLSSSWLAHGAAFSYCLPQSTSSQGFLAIGGNATIRNGDYNFISHAPLVNSSYPEHSDMYFIDVVGMRVGDVDLPIPVGTFGAGKAGTTIDLGTTFTLIVPDVYDLLRDAFLKKMSRYNHLLVPGFAGFDTCFNFTRLDEMLIFPSVYFKFSNGKSLRIGEQVLYYNDLAAGPFGLTCLAFSSLDAGVDVFSAVIGTHTLTSTEVIYDVAGGKVGFIYGSC